MKGVLNGMKAKELTLFTIVLMCATLLLLTWERYQLLKAVIPPPAQFHLSPGLPQPTYVWFFLFSCFLYALLVVNGFVV